MGLRINLKNRMYFRKREISEDAYGATNTKYGEPVEKHYSIQPLSGEADLMEYGEAVNYSYRMFVEKSAMFSQFDGFNVFLPPPEEPDYIIKKIKPWKSYYEIIISATEEADR